MQLIVIIVACIIIYYFVSRKKVNKKSNVKNHSVKQQNRLTEDGELPFGWMAHHQDIVNEAMNMSLRFEQNVIKAKTDKEKYAALKSYIMFLEDGINHYNQIGECEGKYFEQYIADSYAANDFKRMFNELKEKLNK